MRSEGIRRWAEEAWVDPDGPICVICKSRLQVSFHEFYSHLLEHRVRFLEKIIKLYSDCDCDYPPKPGDLHWTFCRRRIGDEALEATLEKMVNNDCRK